MCLSTTGCATTALPTDQSVPTTEVLDRTMTSLREPAGRLIIKRDPGFVGGACAVRASVNGKPLANLRPGEVVTAYLDAGEYILGAASTGICGGGDAEAPLVLKLGETRTYRISIDQGMSIRIGPTAQ
jgi:hypothetical protein